MNKKVQTSTQQVPLGTGSIITNLGLGRIKPFPAMVALTLNYRSNWNDGKTWWTSDRKLADLIGMSHRYVRDALKELTGWVTRIKQGVKGSIYQLTHHLCEPQSIPQDKHGNPLKFAMPRGENAPFEKMFAGEITWKACLIWILLKVHSDFKTGKTHPISMKSLAMWCGFNKKTVCDMIDELKEAGLLERVSAHYKISVFQLYPKPAEKRPVHRPKKRRQKNTYRDMRVDEQHCYSFNEKYRCNLNTANIEVRERHGRGRWHPLKDRERHLVPKPIMEAFNNMIDEAREIRWHLRQALGLDGTDNAHPGADNAHLGADNAHPEFLSSLKIAL